jgi:hypothetical protein
MKSIADRHFPAFEVSESLGTYRLRRFRGMTRKLRPQTIALHVILGATAIQAIAPDMDDLASLRALRFLYPCCATPVDTDDDANEASGSVELAKRHFDCRAFDAAAQPACDDFGIAQSIMSWFALGSVCLSCRYRSQHPRLDQLRSFVC